MIIPNLDPLADELRWCVYCGADCWPEPEHQMHRPSCATKTGLYPVREQDRDPAGGHGCCTACSVPFEVGDVYVLIDNDTGAQAAAPDAGWVVCVGCAATGRDPRENP